MTSDSDRRSSSEVADEADDVRAGLAQTLDQLRNNLRPENMVEEVVSNARIGASTLADGLYDMARQNPLPALLIGAGCALFMGFGARKALTSTDVLDHDVVEDGSVHRPRPLGRAPTLRVKPVERRFASIDQAAASRIDGEVPIGVRSGYGAGSRQRLDSTSMYEDPSRARETMSRFGKTIARSRRRASSPLPGVLHEQPLILAALGVAVGAAIGAVLPRTSAEDEWMGGASSSVRHAAQDVARDEIDELRAVASRTADNYRQAATDHGLSADNFNGLVRDIGDHTKSAIHDVGGTLDPTRS